MCAQQWWASPTSTDKLNSHQSALFDNLFLISYGTPSYLVCALCRKFSTRRSRTEQKESPVPPFPSSLPSAGNLDNTFPNPYLRKRANSAAVSDEGVEDGGEGAEEEYLPAYMLSDWSMERAGRGERKTDSLACELR